MCHLCVSVRVWGEREKERGKERETEKEEGRKEEGRDEERERKKGRKKERMDKREGRGREGRMRNTMYNRGFNFKHATLMSQNIPLSDRLLQVHFSTWKGPLICMVFQRLSMVLAHESVPCS